MKSSANAVTMRKTDSHDLERNERQQQQDNQSSGTDHILITEQEANKTENPSNKENKAHNSFWAGILSCSMYTFCSVSMVLSNKAISTSLSLEDRKRMPQLSVIFFQCVVAVILVEGAKLMRLVDYPAFNMSTAKSWLPLNLLFIGMLVTGFLSLVYVSVPMVTVFKNLTNLITVSGDVYFFGESVSYLTIASVVLMTLGAVLAGANDLEFHALGYFWMVLNCLCTAGYVLYMRFASTNIKLPRFGMVYYNNLLSAALLLPACLANGEMGSLFDQSIMTREFIFWNCVAGFLGFYLNFASLWCVSVTSATTYAVVGALNKVPITILGFLLFHAKMTHQGIMYVAVASFGGLMFGYAKMPTR